MNDIIKKALESTAWPFKEATMILKRIGYKVPKKGYVLFETGYGPSGLPHIGTFGEIVRTMMVRKAFEKISDIPTRLFCISDDMDGLRKVPDVIPNKEEYLKYMDLPLTAIPDPFGTDKSYGDNMNTRLRGFLDSFGFEYEFFSATDCYKKGAFNEMLIKVLENYDAVMDIMLPTLGPERRATYSPFLPVCPKTGKILQVPIIGLDVTSGTISYIDSDGDKITVPVINGHCKLQWKPDFGMRWAAFDVDFEMYGKDHLVNGPIYSRICQAIGGTPPHQMYYELFLDEQGQKISKSKGNGVTLEEWLCYAPQESLMLFMYQSPQKAKKLYFDVIPKTVDEYISLNNSYIRETDIAKKLSNPVYHIHHGREINDSIDISYSLLLNLISACNPDDESVIWGYIKRFTGYDKEQAPEFLKKMVVCGINYYHNFIRPNKKFRIPSEQEKAAMLELADDLPQYKNKSTEEVQSFVYSIGKNHNIELKLWFQGLYEVLLGASQGPRFGSFIVLYGIDETVDLIRRKLFNVEGR